MESGLDVLDQIYQKVQIIEKGWNGICELKNDGKKLLVSVTDAHDSWSESFTVDDLKDHIVKAGMKNMTPTEIFEMMKKSFEFDGNLSLSENDALKVKYKVAGIPLEGKLQLNKCKRKESKETQLDSCIEIMRNLVDVINEKKCNVKGDLKVQLDESLAKIMSLEEQVATLTSELQRERNISSFGVSSSAPIKEKKVRQKKPRNRSVVNPLMRRRRKKRVRVGKH
mmetsp:Transcript_16154/g.24369  ORF Transcript_16154/g.24369 Transcript_16154/m.24369 type:complete len:225 (-) Transcript_16154:60-734(-)